ncbi:MAG: hypothetical protein V1800_08635 [Candidatus Latescibacterota bacterium]
MKAEYDLSRMKSRRNPYAKLFKKQIAIYVDIETNELLENWELAEQHEALKKISPLE